MAGKRVIFELQLLLDGNPIDADRITGIEIDDGSEYIGDKVREEIARYLDDRRDLDQGRYDSEIVDQLGDECERAKICNGCDEPRCDECGECHTCCELDDECEKKKTHCGECKEELCNECKACHNVDCEESPDYEAPVEEAKPVSKVIEITQWHGYLMTGNYIVERKNKYEQAANATVS